MAVRVHSYTEEEITSVIHRFMLAVLCFIDYRHLFKKYHPLYPLTAAPLSLSS